MSYLEQQQRQRQRQEQLPTTWLPSPVTSDEDTETEDNVGTYPRRKNLSLSKADEINREKKQLTTLVDLAITLLNHFFPKTFHRSYNSLHSDLEYLFKTLQVTPPHLLLGFYYLNQSVKVLHRLPSWTIFSCCMMIADKFLNDARFTNKSWAYVSGVDIVTLNNVEYQILDHMDWSLSVQDKDFLQWAKETERIVYYQKSRQKL